MPTDHQPTAALDHVILHGGFARSCRIHINSRVLPHGFYDFVFGPTQNDRVEGMLPKMKIHQTGLEPEKSEINLSGKSFSKVLRLNEIFAIH
tara:strand:- start:389 stop:664 length:276 start_codon:yes stop_codon:yes gene_type:complete